LFAKSNSLANKAQCRESSSQDLACPSIHKRIALFRMGATLTQYRNNGIVKNKLASREKV